MPEDPPRLVAPSSTGFKQGLGLRLKGNISEPKPKSRE